ncbi:MAG: HAMP domain-containing histidine kinase [Flavobacteriales bacterium]|nr:HAMP domain-containing histidine kinase [Flavobacteriales bacterium]MCB9335673.1 HAMP domain-containing histidine kinase [Flavobacteriales bacterium]
MNIYSKKQRWKLLLAGAAILIVMASLWYTNILVKQIADEEREKVQLWAEAIQSKAKLVNYTSELFTKISNEERNRIEIWAEASKRAFTANNNDDISFYIEIIAGNTTIPVIVIDEQGNIVNHRNFDSEKTKDPNYLKQELEAMKATYPPIDLDIKLSRYETLKQQLYYKDSKIFSELKKVMDDLIESFISEIVINSASVPVIYTDSSQTNIIEYGNLNPNKVNNPDYLTQTIEEMKLQNEPIAVTIDNKTINYIFYKDSELLQQLKYYPFIQFFIIGLFLIIAYYLFSTSRKVEQNQVWVGMAKETAHQLGTPLSSLIAWVEYLEAKDTDENTINELRKDINRLEMITERFSKIGSVPKLESENLTEVVEHTLDYLKVRISKKVNIIFDNTNEVFAQVNPSLFSWVLENIIKNAVDAMKGEGNININLVDQSQYIYVDIADTGPGIPRAKHKTIFEPGFTTKQRGWGLGLSLTKRIIENYHSGKIFVKQSDAMGTVFRIVLNK